VLEFLIGGLKIIGKKDGITVCVWWPYCVKINILPNMEIPFSVTT
jgi:hypothetical protein